MRNRYATLDRRCIMITMDTCAHTRTTDWVDGYVNCVTCGAIYPKVISRPEPTVTPMMARAMRMLAANGHRSHVGPDGRLWAEYMFSTSEFIGEAYEVLLCITRQALRDWMGY